MLLTRRLTADILAHAFLIYKAAFSGTKSAMAQRSLLFFSRIIVYLILMFSLLRNFIFDYFIFVSKRSICLLNSLSISSENSTKTIIAKPAKTKKQ